MLIIGKISEEILVYSTTIKMSYVLTGSPELSLLNMRRAVHYKQLVEDLMAGKKKNFILYSIRQLTAQNPNVIKT